MTSLVEVMNNIKNIKNINSPAREPEEKVENIETCILCTNTLSPKDILSCGHKMHMACVKKHFKPECPVCRRKLNIVVTGQLPSATNDLINYTFIPIHHPPRFKTQPLKEPLPSWKRQGYAYKEEDPEYDEENPDGDEVDYPEDNSDGENDKSISGSEGENDYENEYEYEGIDEYNTDYEN